MASSTEVAAGDTADSSFRPDVALPVGGVRLAVGASGTRYRNRNDLTLIELAPGAAVHCLFTRNRFCAAPVTVARAHVAVATPRYLVINAGNANAGTGRAGEEAALAVCAAVAAAAGCRTEEVLPFSTGVIGQQLDVPRLTAAIPALVPALAADGWEAAAAAIMTTDTRLKLRSVRGEFNGRAFTVTGITKGSGMIKPDMATMLGYVATDCAVTPAMLARIAQRACDLSFNRITVDGDTSTNDALVLVATGAAGGTPVASPDDAGYAALAAAVEGVCVRLAQDIVRDGEGATKFITVRVGGGASESDCLAVAYAVAESPLVKTALFASDANWGRILAAVGRAPIAHLDIGAVGIAVGGYPIVAGGEPVAGYEEERASEIMRRRDIDIDIVIGTGPARTAVWTCDLSYEYVKINGEYRS